MTGSFNEETGAGKALIADETASGRLDSWLASALAGEFSRNRIKSLIEGGSVLVNGQAITEPKNRVRPGDRIVISLPEPEEAEPSGENIPLEVLYEDDSVIVIIKPAGIVVHPGAGNWTGTLVNALIHHCGDTLSGIGGVKRPGIVHRLDKETSGVMVIAKNDNAHRSLAAQFADHGKSTSLERAYHAIVWGRPATLRGTVNAALGRSSDRTKRAVKKINTDDARHAVTRYEVIRRYRELPDATCLASSIICRLETGRTHQIRVHMAHIGHPLVGDQEYGAAFRTKANKLEEPARDIVAGFPRQALHAYLLQFEHPQDGRIMRFEAPIPDDMQALISAFEGQPQAFTQS